VRHQRGVHSNLHRAMKILFAVIRRLDTICCLCIYVSSLAQGVLQCDIVCTQSLQVCRITGSSCLLGRSRMHVLSRLVDSLSAAPDLVSVLVHGES
jgi:hypothetical protein